MSRIHLWLKAVAFGFICGALAGAKDARAVFAGCGLMLLSVILEPRK